MTEHGLGHVLDCVAAMKEVLGDEVGLALDCGPGWMLPDAIRFARAVEKHNLMWLEDMLTGDYVPYVNADVYREVTRATSTPIHTGEQIYLRQNFKELIETHAVRVVGPDPCDVGGIAELKWIAEYADLHGILMAPHGTGNGLLGLAALVQVCATLPHNFIAFEYPSRRSRVVVRHRRRAAEPDREGRPHRGLGPARAWASSSCPSGPGATCRRRTRRSLTEPRSSSRTCARPGRAGRNVRRSRPGRTGTMSATTRTDEEDHAMSHSEGRPELNRRTFLAGAAGAAVAGLAGKALAQGSKTGVDAATWTPQHIDSIAGTAEYDTAAECAKVVPLDY